MTNYINTYITIKNYLAKNISFDNTYVDNTLIRTLRNIGNILSALVLQKIKILINHYWKNIQRQNILLIVC